MIDDIRSTAYHEAGHAVMGWLAGQRVRQIRLYAKSNRQLSGKVLFRLDDTFTFHRITSDHKKNCPNIERMVHVVIAIAGPLSEARFCPVEDRSGWGGDHESIVELLEGVPPNDSLIPSLTEVCVKYVLGHWLHVEALAEALLKDGRILKSKNVRNLLGKRTVPLRKVIGDIAAVAFCHGEV
jgi:hypothetical protein